MNNKIIGINNQGMKKLGLDLVDYSDEFKKIKNSLEIIKTNLSKNLNGNIGSQYINSFNDFLKNFDYISESLLNYSDYCIQVIKNYEKYDNNVSVNMWK